MTVQTLAVEVGVDPGDVDVIAGLGSLLTRISTNAALPPSWSLAPDTPTR
jgi:hypothetical protein